MREFESFLSARLDADWYDANEWRGVFPCPGSVNNDGAVWLHITPGYGAAVIVRYPRPAEGRADMRSLRNWSQPEGGGWTRERVLADVEAKREILRMHLRRRSPAWDRDGIIGWECAQCTTEYPCRTLRLIAAPYTGHCDYRKEWTARA